MVIKQDKRTETEKHIDRLKFMIKRIETSGEECLHDFDRDGGVESVLEKLNEQLKYFEGKLKEK